MRLKPSKCFLLIIPINWIKFVEILRSEYTITSQRVSIIEGAFRRKKYTEELYRLQPNPNLHRGIFYQIIDVFRQILRKKPLLFADISLYPSKSSYPFCVLKAIKNAPLVEERIRFLINQDKKERGIRIID
ncbi:MAG: hypothetical protein DSM107014_02535 [Gomphosphaeria aponina SAG 52.96 = DSM 107014]|uniref:Uncharacterized protein n=1 Tax=Gomphosphaeria aponina SAG 52.96 = DSM 107014 TaxID=1521640 RepID=A0A941GN20_9CHRO|nr:hypothetical protein [Gomphosphaeria aponina SAG 52.96 = DSM 107014]